MIEENKENLREETVDNPQVNEEPTVDNTQATSEEKVIDEGSQPEKEENTELKVEETAVKDSEKYYDDIDYQKKENTEEVKKKTRSVLREILDWVLCFIVAYIVYLNINYFLFSVPGVKQESMYPTIENGERVFVIRTWLLGRDLEYGDIVTFEAPIDNKYYLDTEDSVTAQYDQYTGLTLFLYEFMNVNKVEYIKRVIGVAGDHIEIKDGNVYRNGELLVEDYIRGDETEVQEEEYADVIVPEGTVYVMGDNRAQSKDSRTFGCIPLERVDGYVVGRIWPLSKFGSID